MTPFDAPRPFPNDDPADASISDTGDGFANVPGTARLVRGLGWFSLGLGLAEMLTPRAVARASGLDGHETLLRLFGAREFTAGLGLLLAGDKEPWVLARLAGDGLDGAALAYAMRPGNPGRGRALVSLLAVSPVIAADALCAARLRRARSRASSTAELASA